MSACLSLELMLNPINPFVVPEMVLMLMKMMPLKYKMHYITCEIGPKLPLHSAGSQHTQNLLAHGSRINIYLIHDTPSTLHFLHFTLYIPFFVLSSIIVTHILLSTLHI